MVIAAALLLFLVIAGGMIYRQIQGHQVKEAWAERLERGEERRARKAAEAEEAMAESEGVLDFPWSREWTYWRQWTGVP